MMIRGQPLKISIVTYYQKGILVFNNWCMQLLTHTHTFRFYIINEHQWTMVHDLATLQELSDKHFSLSSFQLIHFKNIS